MATVTRLALVKRASDLRAGVDQDAANEAFGFWSGGQKKADEKKVFLAGFNAGLVHAISLAHPEEIRAALDRALAHHYQG